MPVSLVLDAHQGRLAAARKKLEVILASQAPAGARIPVLLEAMRLGLAEGLGRTLLAALEEVTPSARRLALLDGLERFPRWQDRETLNRIAKLLPGVDAEGQDPTVTRLRLAEFERVCGRNTMARQLIEQATDDA